jgi:hypothetical protein
MDRRKKNRATDPSRLSQFFDQEWARTAYVSRPLTGGNNVTGSRQFMNERSYQQRPQTYNTPLYLNGSLGDPEQIPFSKFTESAQRVILAENPTSEGTFTRPLSQARALVRSECQEDSALAMSQKPSAGVVPVVDQPEFKYGFVSKTGVRLEPEYRTMSAEPLNRLKMPSESRAEMQFTKRHHAARKKIRQAAAQQNRLEFIMQNEYRSGAMGVDSPCARDSRIYSDRALANSRRQIGAQDHAGQRLENLKSHTVSAARRGYDFVHHTTSAPPSLKVIQAKQAVADGPPKDTWKRLFYRPPVPINQARADHLRWQDTGGKRHDIISGTMVMAPPSGPIRHQMRQAHPSVMVQGLPHLRAPI